MKLYCLQGACSLGIHIMLVWTGQPHEVVMLDRAQLASPEFRKINPRGAVPALVDDDGWVLLQNVAILDYLAALHPQLQLAGDGSPRSRATVMRWLAFINADVHTAFVPLFAPQRLGVEGSQADTVQAYARKTLHGLFQVLDGQLADQPFITGQQRSMADPYLYVVMRWARALKVDLTSMTNLDIFMKHMGADPGVREALRVEGLADLS